MAKNQTKIDWSKTKTFTSVCGNFQFTVAEYFYNRYFFAIQEEGVYELNTKYNMPNYLHNEHGPAIVYLQVDQPPSFWLNGKEVTEDDLPRLKHNKDFAKAVDEILDI